MSEHKSVGEKIPYCGFRNFRSTLNRTKWPSRGGQAVGDMLQTRKREDIWMKNFSPTT